MNGLELSYQYYLSYGKSMIETKFPSYSDRIACGLVGKGSECFGYDDNISQDHDWGVGFCLWLNKEDFKIIGNDLQKEYNNLPESFKGYSKITSERGKQRKGVFEIESFYTDFIGRSNTPQNFIDWFSIPENVLANCLNGKIFIDKLGKFSQIRNSLLSYYPADVQKIKMVSKCISAGQSGQYNFLRALDRNDIYVLKYCEMLFCKEIISLAFLLNKTYQPFYKWAYRKLQELPLLGEYLHEGINSLLNTNDNEQKVSIIEILSKKIIEVLIEEKMSNLNSTFLVDHGLYIYKKLDNNELKKNIKIG